MSISGRTTRVVEICNSPVPTFLAPFCEYINVSSSTKLRAVGGGGGGGGYPPSVRSAGLAQPGLAGLASGHQTGLGSDGLSYERSPGDTNNSESGDSQSMPASVTSLSE